MIKTNKQNGFTIVELVVTIMLFAVLIPSIANFLVFLGDLNSRSRNLTSVSAIAQNKIEDLRSKGFLAVNVGTVDFTNELPDQMAKPRQASYTVTHPGGNPSLKDIKVTINYTDTGGQHSYNFKTYLGELGVGQY